MLDAMRKTGQLGRRSRRSTSSSSLVFIFWGVGTMRANRMEVAARVNERGDHQAREFDRAYTNLVEHVPQHGQTGRRARRRMRCCARRPSRSSSPTSCSSRKRIVSVSRWTRRSCATRSPRCRNFQVNGQFDKDSLPRDPASERPQADRLRGAAAPPTARLEGGRHRGAAARTSATAEVQGPLPLRERAREPALRQTAGGHVRVDKVTLSDKDVQELLRTTIRSATASPTACASRWSTSVRPDFAKDGQPDRRRDQGVLRLQPRRVPKAGRGARPPHPVQGRARRQRCRQGDGAQARRRGPRQGEGGRGLRRARQGVLAGLDGGEWRRSRQLRPRRDDAALRGRRIRARAGPGQ